MIKGYLQRLNIWWTNNIINNKRSKYLLLKMFIILLFMLGVWGSIQLGTSVNESSREMSKTGQEHTLLRAEGRRTFSVEYTDLYVNIFNEAVSTEQADKDLNMLFKDIESVHKLLTFKEILTDKNKQEYREDKIKFYNDLKIFLQ